MTEKTNDEYIMPFGKYKGKAIGDVPASYLLWFYDQVWSKKHRAVYGYVFEHKKLLEKEAENYRMDSYEIRLGDDWGDRDDGI